MSWAHWSNGKPWVDRERVKRGIRCNSKWNRWRRRYLMAHPTCARCGLAGEEVHHVIPRAQRPDLMYEVGNVMTLCRACHREAHNLSPDKGLRDGR